MDIAPVINLRGIRFAYAGGAPVFDGLDWRVDAGARLGLHGAIGSGKTTLFHLVLGLLKPLAGTVEVLGRARTCEKDFGEVRRRIGLVFQEPGDQLFSPTVAEDVAFGPLNLGLPRDQVQTRVRETLAAVGLEGYERRITYQLSGGEKRLAALAGVLAMRPEMLLLDEPFTGLDDAAEARVTAALAGSGVGYVIISHRRDQLASLTDRVVELRGGRITDPA